MIEIENGNLIDRTGVEKIIRTEVYVVGILSVK